MYAEYEDNINLYKRIAKLRLNETVVVKNRKDKKETIHITNIVNLSWHQLQLLDFLGKNRFTKMINIYNQYSHTPIQENEIILKKDIK